MHHSCTVAPHHDPVVLRRTGFLNHFHGQRCHTLNPRAQFSQWTLLLTSHITSNICSAGACRNSCVWAIPESDKCLLSRLCFSEDDNAHTHTRLLTIDCDCFYIKLVIIITDENLNSTPKIRLIVFEMYILWKPKPVLTPVPMVGFVRFSLVSKFLQTKVSPHTVWSDGSQTAGNQH